MKRFVKDDRGFRVVARTISGTEPPLIMEEARNPQGDYIGTPKNAAYLCGTLGIKPEKAELDHNVCSIGFSPKDGKWYGWSHRAIYGFKVGDVVKEGDCTAEEGLIEEYLADHPEERKALPVGFVAKTVDDARTMAVAFAASVS